MDKNATKKQNREFFSAIKGAIPAYCSSCGYKYKDENLTLIKKDDYAAILHLSCPSCNESYLINVVSPMGILQGSSRMPLKIDISTAEEAKKFMGKSPVSSDDVLNLHELLKDVKTGEDLAKLLKM